MAAARSAKSFSQQVATASRARSRSRLRPPRRRTGRVSGRRLRCRGRVGQGVGTVPARPLPRSSCPAPGKGARGAVGASGDAHLAQRPAVAPHHRLGAHGHGPSRLFQSPAAAPGHRPT